MVILFLCCSFYILYRLLQTRQDQQSQKKRYVAVPEDVKKDEVNYFPVYDTSRQRCKLCPRNNSAFSYIKCMKCNAHLCLNKDRNCSPMNIDHGYYIDY